MSSPDPRTIAAGTALAVCALLLIRTLILQLWEHLVEEQAEQALAKRLQRQFPIKQYEPPLPKGEAPIGRARSKPGAYKEEAS